LKKECPHWGWLNTIFTYEVKDIESQIIFILRDYKNELTALSEILHKFDYSVDESVVDIMESL